MRAVGKNKDRSSDGKTARSTRIRFVSIASVVLIGFIILISLGTWRQIISSIKTNIREISVIRNVIILMNQSAIDKQLVQGHEKIREKNSLVKERGLLRKCESNPRYFCDGNGRLVYLTGSHTWSNFQDNGSSFPPPAFDYKKYLDFLQVQNHNFFRLWVWEQSRWTSECSDDSYWFFPMSPYRRTGPENALDGKLKFDLNQFDQAYFDRIRDRVIQAGDRGIYVAVMLFNGWSVLNKGELENPWKGHPFNMANNINDIDGDKDKDGYGVEVHELADPTILKYQKAYVRRLIETLNDLDNVLYEISNESEIGSTQWQYEIIKYIKQVESTLPKQHPVGMTANGDNVALFNGPADWVSPGSKGYGSNPPAETHGKVVILDTDHIWGIGGNEQWVWKSFMRGLNPIFMDGYDGAGYGVGGSGFRFNDPRWIGLRKAMGDTRSYAERVDLASMIPCTGNITTDIASSGYCLSNGLQFLAYLPQGGMVTMNLTGSNGKLMVEWFNASTGEAKIAEQVNGGVERTFVSPFGSMHTVLYLY